MHDNDPLPQSETDNETRLGPFFFTFCPAPGEGMVTVPGFFVPLQWPPVINNQFRTPPTAFVFTEFRTAAVQSSEEQTGTHSPMVTPESDVATSTKVSSSALSSASLASIKTQAFGQSSNHTSTSLDVRHSRSRTPRRLGLPAEWTAFHRAQGTPDAATRLHLPPRSYTSQIFSEGCSSAAPSLRRVPKDRSLRQTASSVALTERSNTGIRPRSSPYTLRSSRSSSAVRHFSQEVDSADTQVAGCDVRYEDSELAASLVSGTMSQAPRLPSPSPSATGDLPLDPAAVLYHLLHSVLELMSTFGHDLQDLLYDYDYELTPNCTGDQALRRRHTMPNLDVPTPGSPATKMDYGFTPVRGPPRPAPPGYIDVSDANFSAFNTPWKSPGQTSDLWWDRLAVEASDGNVVMRSLASPSAEPYQAVPLGELDLLHDSDDDQVEPELSSEFLDTIDEDDETYWDRPLGALLCGTL